MARRIAAGGWPTAPDCLLAQAAQSALRFDRSPIRVPARYRKPRQRSRICRPGRNDGLEALPRQLGAGRAQVPGTSPTIRQDMDLGTGAARLRSRAGSASLGGAPGALACARTPVPSRRTANRSGLACKPSGAARWPDRPRRPGDDRPSFPPVRGRPPMPGGTRARHSAQRSREKTTARCVAYVEAGQAFRKDWMRSRGLSVIGEPSSPEAQLDR